MKQDELTKYLPRVKKRVNSPRYRIYKVSKRKYHPKIGKWRLALLGSIEGRFLTFDLALMAFQLRLKRYNENNYSR